MPRERAVLLPLLPLPLLSPLLVLDSPSEQSSRSEADDEVHDAPCDASERGEEEGVEALSAGELFRPVPRRPRPP